VSPTDFPAIIPAPSSLKIAPTKWLVPAQVAISAPTEHADLVELGNEIWRTWRMGEPFVATGESGIVCEIDDDFADEEYNLAISDSQIDLRAGGRAGLVHGMHTLLQLWPEPESADRSIRGCEIHDKPRFAWRGGHLDVCRHFMPNEFIYRFIDLLALMKFNVFHWHLTEDQGWRIEIKRYPKLNEIGAWRAETVIGHARAPEGYDGKVHGGFYTQEEIRKIVAYACARGINIVPEIEMPGHAQAAIASYPELGNGADNIKPWTTFGVSEHVYNVNPSTFDFLFGVLDEVLELFPSTHIHIGGDECPKTEWKSSAQAQQVMQENNLADEDELQSWFIGKVSDYLMSRGRKLVGWDEILEGGLAPGAIVMSWRGEAGGIEAAQHGHDVVMTPGAYTYFDHYQSADKENEPLAIGGCTPIEKVCEYNPVPAGLSEQQAKHVLGSQFQLWTEYMPTPKDVERMMLPRAFALSEVLWSPNGVANTNEFMDRLPHALRLLDRAGINYRPLDRK